MPTRYLLPPSLTGPGGEPRRVGFEFEMGNLQVTRAAQALQSALGGKLEVLSPFEAVLTQSSLGKLKVERDAQLLKSTVYRKWLTQFGVNFAPGTLAHEIETNIDSVSRVLIPCEVVTEPIPFDALAGLDDLVETLKALGAEGTQESLIYAFGMHINPSIPGAGADILGRYIQAFLLLHGWIIEYAEIDLTRRFLTKYIDPYPRPYMERVLARDYQPDLDTLIDDYLAFNPTRNRALDMLPVFCTLDEERVRKALGEDEQRLVSARPAFHYRLPDCKVDVPGWSAAQAWNLWVYIEKLAADRALLDELKAEWRRFSGDFSLSPRSEWTARLTSLLSCKFFER